MISQHPKVLLGTDPKPAWKRKHSVARKKDVTTLHEITRKCADNELSGEVMKDLFSSTTIVKFAQRVCVMQLGSEEWNFMSKN